MKHDVGPTPAEIAKFTSRSPMPTPPMTVTCKFQADLATRLDVDQVSFDVPPGFQLERFVESWNKDCKVVYQTLVNKRKETAGIMVTVTKAKIVLMIFTGVYR